MTFLKPYDPNVGAKRNVDHFWYNFAQKKEEVITTWLQLHLLVTAFFDFYS